MKCQAVDLVPKSFHGLATEFPFVLKIFLGKRIEVFLTGEGTSGGGGATLISS